MAGEREAWRLETIEVDCVELLDSDIQTIAFVCLQISLGRLALPRKVQHFFGEVAGELATLADFRREYLEFLDLADVADVPGDD